MSALSTGAIYDALCALEREVEFRWNVGGSANIERYRDLKRTVQAAKTEERALSEALPRLRALKAEADRQYDRHVTRISEPEADGCSCHINPPCGYCTREGEEEAAA